MFSSSLGLHNICNADVTCTNVLTSGTPVSGHPSPEDTLSIMDNFVGPNGVRLREVPLESALLSYSYK